jgi:hypothetical protein
MPEPVQDVVTPADYLSTVARAYLAAPPSTPEERLLDQALDNVCARLNVDRDRLLRRIIDTAPVVRAEEVFPHHEWQLPRLA